MHMISMTWAKRWGSTWEAPDKDLHVEDNENLGHSHVTEIRCI